LSGSAPAFTGAHVPWAAPVLAARQDWHFDPQARSQQMPSAQAPLAHSSFWPQPAAIAFLARHTPPLQ
jgi:hypothetical protein